jgi:DNA-binding NtrC family response regulator
MEKTIANESQEQEYALTIALVDNDGAFAQDVAAHLQRFGIETHQQRKLAKMVEELGQLSPDFLVLSVRDPDSLDLKLIKAIGKTQPGTRMICLLAPDLTSYDELLRQAGIQRIVPLQLKPRQLADMLMTMADLRQLENQNYRLRQMLDGRSSYENLIGGSLPMRAMYRLLDQIARTDSPVLITGEQGTEGVDVAKAIHRKSERTVQPLVVVDCLKCKDDPDGTAVFGPRGSGAYGTGPCPRVSAFAKAGKGTVVLHHVECLHIQAQKRLLDFMHRPFFQDETPGTPQPLSRIVATSCPDLLARVEDGAFLRELFYRLNILQVRVPPLRERREDIPMLAQYYLRFTEAGKNGRHNGRGISFSSRALLHLFQHDWKGNLEELRDLVEALADKANGLEIDAQDLPTPVQHSGDVPAELKPLPYTDRSLKEAKRLFETEYFKDLLKRTGGNMTLASRLSRVGRPYLYKKIREYEINPEEFR